MSPVSRKRQKKRNSKPANRTPAVRREDDSDRAAADTMDLYMEEVFESTLRSEDPFDAELMVTELLGFMRGVDDERRGAPVETVDAFIEVLAARMTPAATAVLVVLARLAPAEASRKRAQRRLGEPALRGVSRPAWAESIDAWEPGRVMVVADVFGDQETVLVEFTGRGRSHALVVLVDFSHLGGWCSEMFVVEDADLLIAEMANGASATEGLMRCVSLDPAAAHFLIGRALAATEVMHAPEVGESFDETYALALARLRLLPAVPTQVADAAVGDALRLAGLPVPSALRDPVPVPAQERADLAERFRASSHAVAFAGVAPDSVEHLTRLVIDYGCDYDDGRPLRVSPIKLANFLLRWLPRKAVLDATDREAVPAVIGAWVQFALGQSELPPTIYDPLLAELPVVLGGFVTGYDNLEGFGPARALPDGIGEVDSWEVLQAIVSERVAALKAPIRASGTH